MSKIAPCLWFDGEAEEAAKFYVSLLPDSRIDRVQKNVSDGPSVLPKLLGDPDPAKARRVMEALLKMVKLDIAGLERAHAGGKPA